MATAYSYLRFSSPQQAKGDSVRRQTEATAAWCERNKVALDTSLSLRDEGVSAFKGRNRSNPDEFALAAFLKLVEGGRVPTGSYLVLENLDRLTRESIVPAVHLFTGILLSGVRIVQLMPAEQVFTSGADMTAVMLALVELSRGHSESAAKSERVGQAWANKRRAAVEKRIVTSKLPGWIRRDGAVREGDKTIGGKLVIDPARAKIVRQVYDLALKGHGTATIARMMNENKAPLLGRSKITSHRTGVVREIQWNQTVVYHLLTARSVIGELQPCKGRGSTRRPVGDPIPDYFPAVITREQFHAVQSHLKTRAKVRHGRRGHHLNIFSGLLFDARDGGTLTYKHHSKRTSAIIPVGAKHGRISTWTSFEAEAFEDELLDCLTQEDAPDIFGENNRTSERITKLTKDKGEAEDMARRHERKCEDARIAKNEPEWNYHDDKRAKWAEEVRRIEADLAQTQREAAAPLTEAWSNFKNWRERLRKEPGDDNRERCRAALRRTIAAVWVLIATGRPRICAVQVWFKGEAGRHKDYIIVNVPQCFNGKVRHKRRSQGHSAEKFAGKGGFMDFRHLTRDRLGKLLRSLKAIQDEIDPATVPAREV
jgi:DNA invertase Pin-like site-specific DNA recombinase